MYCVKLISLSLCISHSLSLSLSLPVGVGEEGLFEDVQDEKVKVLQQMFFGVLLCALATLAAKGDMVFTSIFMGGVAAMAGYWLSDRTTQHLVSLPGVSDHYVWMFFVPLCSASNDKGTLPTQLREATLNATTQPGRCRASDRSRPAIEHRTSHRLPDQPSTKIPAQEEEPNPVWVEPN
uniref:Pecanex-like protein n=1 Tax=Hucho hucho TaxID=62062 RepID=A0A4W5Q8Y7_9TELE